MISTQFKSDATSVTNRRGETVSKPEMIVKYNKYMGGIDHQDQMLSYYSCEHKTIRWYKKLGIHMFQQMLYNSYTLHNIFSPTKSLYDYRLEIISKLLSNMYETLRVILYQKIRCMFFNIVRVQIMATRKKLYDVGVGSAGYQKKYEKTLLISVPTVPNNTGFV